MATKPKLKTLAEERIPMLSSPAGICIDTIVCITELYHTRIT